MLTMFATFKNANTLPHHIIASLHHDIQNKVTNIKDGECSIAHTVHNTHNAPWKLDMTYILNQVWSETPPQWTGDRETRVMVLMK